MVKHITQSMSDEEERAYFRAWLLEQSPRTWHQVALSWNWDYGIEDLDFILDQPSCDAGTALSLYTLSEPNYFADRFTSLKRIKEECPWEYPVADFAARICERWAAGHFRTYQFHPCNFLDQHAGCHWDETESPISPHPLWTVPPSMLEAPFRGEPVDLEAFHEGRPIEWCSFEDPLEEKAQEFLRHMFGLTP